MIKDTTINIVYTGICWRCRVGGVKEFVISGHFCVSYGCVRLSKIWQKLEILYFSTGDKTCLIYIVRVGWVFNDSVTVHALFSLFYNVKKLDSLKE